MPDAPPPRHASTELLSAYLDGRVDRDEARFLAEHLAECRDCEEELAGVRAVRELLRALPAVEPPRSFALPVPLSQTAPVRIVRFPRMLGLTRAAAAVAAVFFALFLTADLAGLGEARRVSVGDFQAAGAMKAAPPPAPAAVAPTPGQPAPSAQARSVQAGQQGAQAAPAATSRAGAPVAPRESQPDAAAAEYPARAAAESIAPTAAPWPAATPAPASSARTAESAADRLSTGTDAQPNAPGEVDGSRAHESDGRLAAMAASVRRLTTSPSPLRWSWIGSGALAVALVVGSLVVGRGRGTR